MDDQETSKNYFEIYELSTTSLWNIKQYFQNYPFQETKQKHNAALHPIDSYTKVNDFY